MVRREDGGASGVDGAVGGADVRGRVGVGSVVCGKEEEAAGVGAGGVGSWESWYDGEAGSGSDGDLGGKRGFGGGSGWLWWWMVGVGHFGGRKAGPGLVWRRGLRCDAMRWASVLEMDGGGDGGGGVWNALKQCRNKLSRLRIVAMCGAGFSHYRFVKLGPRCCRPRR